MAITPQISCLGLKRIHPFVERVVRLVREVFVLHLALELLQLGGDLVDALLAAFIGLDRPRIDPAEFGHGSVIVLDDRIGPGEARLRARLFSCGGKFLKENGLDQRRILEHGMLV